jgi:DNA-binding transcriptional MerR regulator
VEDLISIGQFAAASRLSPKALRLYDENGLLPPARVDPDSGYRFYRLEQLRDATLIGLLRRAGMPLADIRSFLADRSEARLDEYELGLEAELAERREVLAYVRQLIREAPMFEVKTRHMESQRYVSRSTRVRVAELEPFIVSTISGLMEGRDATDDAFTLYHGEVNEEADGPVEVCVPTETGDKRLPASDVAFTVAAGPQCRFPEIIGAYDAVARWAKEHGRELDGPPREIYRFDPARGEEPRMEIAWPIR